MPRSVRVWCGLCWRRGSLPRRSRGTLSSTRAPCRPGSTEPRAADAQAAGGLNESEREELRRLREETARQRKEIAELEMDRDVLPSSLPPTNPAWSLAIHRCRPSGRRSTGCARPVPFVASFTQRTTGRLKATTPPRSRSTRRSRPSTSTPPLRHPRRGRPEDRHLDHWLLQHPPQAQRRRRATTGTVRTDHQPEARCSPFTDSNRIDEDSTLSAYSSEWL